MVKPNKSFPIFNPVKRFYISQDILILTPFLVFTLAWYWLPEDSVIAELARITALVNAFVLLFFLFYRFFQTEKIRGHFKGQLELHLNGISIGDKRLALQDIHKLEFKLDDWQGKVINSYLTLQPFISNGTHNSVCIETISEKKEVRFLQVYEDEFLLATKEILISYHKEGLISFLHLIEILKIDNYEEIQAFKKELLEGK